MRESSQRQRSLSEPSSVNCNSVLSVLVLIRARTLAQREPAGGENSQRIGYKLRTPLFQAFLVFHMDAKDAQSGGEDGGTDDQTQQSKCLQATQDTDEEKQVIQAGAIAQQQRADDIIRDAGNAAANGEDQNRFPPMPGEAKPECGGKPDQRGTDDGNDGKESNQHAHEDRRGQSGEFEGKAAQQTLNGGDEQSDGDACEDQVTRFVEHFVLDFRFKRDQVADSTKNLFSIAKHEKQCKQEDEEINEKR